jgi:hypothetical protein
MSDERESERQRKPILQESLTLFNVRITRSLSRRLFQLTSFYDPSRLGVTVTIGRYEA